jgi:hypothetical protein
MSSNHERPQETNEHPETVPQRRREAKGEKARARTTNASTSTAASTGRYAVATENATVANAVSIATEDEELIQSIGR